VRHPLQAEGFGVRLRPVQVSDAAFIVWLRNLDHVLGKVGDSATDLAGQQAWLHAYFARGGDYYFVIETLGGIPVGTYGLYDIVGTSAEHGRLIMRPEVPAVLPCLMDGFGLAFGPMALTELRGTVVSTNRQVVSLLRKLGFRQTRLEAGGRVIAGKAVDMVHLVLSREDWSRTCDKFLPLAVLAERQVLEWDQAHPQESN
jgi:RimJ/RimL family protein N-acetyltransferase